MAEACVNGVCGECIQDGDCCPPLVCDEGVCRPYVSYDPDNPPPCKKCGYCLPEMACIDGVCGVCAVDDDCCYPRECEDGRCLMP